MTSPSKYAQICGNPWARGMPASARKRRAPGLSTDQFRNLRLDATPAAKSSAAITTARLSPRPTRQRSLSAVRTANEPVSSASGTGVWSDYDTPKVGDERVAKTLPTPVLVTQWRQLRRAATGIPRRRRTHTSGLTDAASASNARRTTRTLRVLHCRLKPIRNLLQSGRSSGPSTDSDQINLSGS